MRRVSQAIKMEPIHVLSTIKFDEALLAQIRAVSERIVLSQHPAADAAQIPAEALAQAEVIYTYGALPNPDQAPRLRWVALNSAGRTTSFNTRCLRRM